MKEDLQTSFPVAGTDKPMTAKPTTAAATNRAAWVVQDTLVVAWRYMIGYRRVPEALFFSSVQPIMFILLFRYVFGGAIGVRLPHSLPYVDYLMPGIFVQTVIFGSIATAIGLAEDLQKGLIERFRALPMARSALLAGRTTADLVRNIWVVILMTAVGYAVGFRVHTSVAEYLLGVLVLLAFAYALSWGFAVIGLSAPNSETAQVMTFPILFPLTMASSAFVPVATMPGWLQAWARNQPVSIVVDVARGLMEGRFSMFTSNSVGNETAIALAWCVGLMVVLVPLAVRRYRLVGGGRAVSAGSP